MARRADARSAGTVRRPAPRALHLGRLAKGSPDALLALPGSDGLIRTAHLTRVTADGDDARWYVCLAGELLIDLPHNDFVHLRPHDTYRVPRGTPRTLTPVGTATVLLIDDTAPPELHPTEQ